MGLTFISADRDSLLTELANEINKEESYCNRMTLFSPYFRVKSSYQSISLLQDISLHNRLLVQVQFKFSSPDFFLFDSLQAG